MASSQLERLATACIFPGFDGVEASEWISRECAAGLGGVVLFSRNLVDPDQTRALCAELRRDNAGLLIGLDEEGGDVTRLELASGSSYPGPHALGAVDDVELTAQVARAIGGDLAAVGVDLELAPVADVNTDPRNPVIGIRSFGDDAARVARHVAAFTRGVQAAGVAACAKHFPGHGETHVDSHLGLPVVDVDLETLRERELEPFRAAIEAGVRAVMTAHIVVPALDAEPATCSPRHLTELLRGELGFRGVAMTDALEMGAIADGIGMGEGAVRALGAGADALCLGAEIAASHVEGVRGAIVAAVESGRLALDRLEEAAGRIAELQAWTSPVAGEVDRGIGLAAARRAVRTEGLVALARAPFVVELVPEPGIAAGPAGHRFGEALAARDPRTRSVCVTAPSPAAELLAHAGEHQLVIVVRDPARHPWVASLAGELLAGSPDAIVVDVGLPTGWTAGRAAGVITTHGGGRASYEAAAEVLR
ncbi:MAG: glycoside hydrolase family 3 protein [Gaiellales bacterium]